ncbi:MAG: cytochrome c [Gammaproteobacteria bacterium]|nr:cytochrome c [Gammaproteobacteria bacterium]
MKKITALLAFALLVLSSHIVSAEEQKKVTLKLPPASIGQWYKPENKRQVWLHVMFNLRREMQAIALYSASGEKELMIKWAEKLAKDYNKAAELVPEWKADIQPELADKLLQAAKASDLKEVGNIQRQLGSQCRDCHDTYRAITVAMYRAPDFSEISVEDEENMELLDMLDTMENLSMTLNQVVIGIADQKFDTAQLAQEKLLHKLTTLGQVCENCHTDNRAKEYLLGPLNNERFKKLAVLLDQKESSEAGKLVGEIAVTVCARCHGIHRTSADMRDELFR